MYSTQENPAVAADDLRTARHVALALLAVVAVIATVHLVTWTRGSSLEAGDGEPSMKVNTCLGLIAAAAGIWAAATRRKLAIVLCLFVIVLDGLVLLEHLLVVDLHIDLLFLAQKAVDSAAPGRTELGSAFALVVIAVGGCSLALDRRALVEPCAFVTGIIGLLALIMHVYEDDLLHGKAALTIAVHTALCLVLLAIALLASNPTGRFTQIIIARTAGGALARRLMPFALFVPIALGWIRLESIRAQLIQPRTGLALLELVAGLLFVVIVWRSSSMLDVSDSARRAARHLTETARRDAETANRSKDEFLAMLGHELRNPLAPIFAALEIMALRDPDGISHEHRVIERQSRGLERLVNDLLDVSRIVRGELRLVRVPTTLGAVLHAATETTEPLLQRNRHVVTLRGAFDEAWVSADSDRLVQVFSNLLVNASKHTPPEGTIEISLRSEADTWVIAVHDSGSGIAPELLPRVFEMFVQAPQTIERRQGGLGLGLAIVNNLVRLHGGSAVVHSAGKGRGTTVTVRLPAIATQPLTTTLPHVVSRATSQVAPQRTRVLVVDDNRDSAELIAELLERHGFETLVVYDGESALGAEIDFAPAIMLVDIGLPNLDGHELARRLRQRPRTTQLHLFAMTGFGGDDERARSRAAGFDDHLVKPVAWKPLLALLQSLSRG